MWKSVVAGPWREHGGRLGNPAAARARGRLFGRLETDIILPATALTADAFAPFGDVIETAGRDSPFLVVVAPNGPVPDANSIRVFLSSGSQGVNYRRNTEPESASEVNFGSRAFHLSTYEHWALSGPPSVG
jgi:hypothetical protein